MQGHENNSPRPRACGQQRQRCPSSSAETLQSCEGKRAELQTETLGIAKGWGTKGSVQHNTVFLRSSSSLLIPCMHRTDLFFRVDNFARGVGTTFSRHLLDKTLSSLPGYNSMAREDGLSELDGRDSHVPSQNQIQDSSLNKAPRATINHSRERALCILNRNELKDWESQSRNQMRYSIHHLLLQGWRTRNKYKTYYKESSYRHFWATFVENYFLKQNQFTFMQ